MKVRVIKSKKDIMMDNLKILVTGVRGIVLLVLVAVSLAIMIYGNTAGIFLILVPAAFIGISMVSTNSLLKKIEGDEAVFEYEIQGDFLNMSNPVGNAVVRLEDIVGLRKMRGFTVIQIKTEGGKFLSMPIYSSGRFEGDNIENFLDNLECSIRAIRDRSNTAGDEVSAEMDEMKEEKDKIEETNAEEIEEVEQIESAEEFHEESILKSEKEVDNRAEEKEESLEIQPLQEKKEEIVVSKPISEENEVVHMRNLLKFKNSLINDIKRQYKIMFSKVSAIFVLFTALTLGVKFVYDSNAVLSVVFFLLTAVILAAPVLDGVNGWREHRGVVTLGIDEHDYLVINNGDLVKKVHKDKVAVGKASNGEIILSISSNKNRPYGISMNEIVEGDPYELFKIFKVGKVKDFNWFGVGALGLATVGVSQMLLGMVWSDINTTIIGMIAAAVFIIGSGALAYFALTQKEQVKKQASWAILFDIILVVYYIFRLIKG